MSTPPKSRGGRGFPLPLDRITPPAKTFVGSPLNPRPAEPAPLAGGLPKPEGGAARAVLRPQRPLQQAAQDRARAVPAPLHPAPDLERVRRQMVVRLRELGLRDERVAEALLQVPRHQFVDAGLVAQAYEDTSLPIGFGQTISKPSVVARMLELACAGRAAAPARVLEIGTGCGYQAALLTCLARQVVSIERIGPLHDKARELLAPLCRSTLRLVHGDGRLGHAPLGPYDAIIAAAGGEDIPAAWLEQLAPGGRLVAPVAAAGQGQVLWVVDRRFDGSFVNTRHEAVHFVPLKSGLA